MSQSIKEVDAYYTGGLKRSKVESFQIGTRERVIAETCWEFGWVQGDRNSGLPDAGKKGVGFGTFPLTQDVCFAGLKFERPSSAIGK